MRWWITVKLKFREKKTDFTNDVNNNSTMINKSHAPPLIKFLKTCIQKGLLSFYGKFQFKLYQYDDILQWLDLGLLSRALVTIFSQILVKFEIFFYIIMPALMTFKYDFFVILLPDTCLRRRDEAEIFFQLRTGHLSYRRKLCSNLYHKVYLKITFSLLLKELIS